ncbi:MAG: hypothetical protein DMF83_29710 [Acidobacteria bacterium]|nr:MAG: hypothetical protein DMF83_29710 [Acidobacteriota bacterium]
MRSRSSSGKALSGRRAGSSASRSASWMVLRARYSVASGRALTSVYFRDPDDNLVEFTVYDRRI